MRPESGYSWVRYGLAVALVASTLLVGLAIGPALGEGPPLALLLAAVSLAAGYGGLRPALAAYGQKSRRRNEEGRSLEIGTPSGTALQERLE